MDLGNGSEGFKFEEVQHLMALLWTFEPQLNTLHPSDRLDNKHCKSMRDKSVFARTFKNQHGRRPTPQEGVAHLLNNRYKELIQLSGDRNSACNFYNLLYVTTSDVVKKTFEFRQNRGVLDPSAVSNWVQTVVGVVDFIQHITPNALVDVLSLTERETCERLYDGQDDKRERENDPTLAEQGFTVIDLLKYMKLWGPAKFYDTRLYRHDKLNKKECIPSPGLPKIVWEYESIDGQDSEVFRQQHGLRKIWEAARLLSEAQSPGSFDFDTDHPRWPAHHQSDTPNQSQCNPS